MVVTHNRETREAMLWQPTVANSTDV